MKALRKNDNGDLKRKIERTLNLSCVILTLLAVLGIILRVADLSGPPEQERYWFGYRVGLVMSDSMEPAIPTYSLIIEKEVTDAEPVKQGDIISYFYRTEENRLIRITHRIIAMDEEGLTMKGDHNSGSDPDKIPREAVLSKVVLVLPHFIQWSSVAVGIVILLVLCRYRYNSLLFSDKM